jgi:hypothetical protein
MNLEAMARNIGEVIKEYEERKELVPVPAPISSKQKRMPPPPAGMIMPPPVGPMSISGIFNGNNADMNK